MISLIHPSRGRADKARKTFDYWMGEASGNTLIQHIISIDFDDDVASYIKCFQDWSIKSRKIMMNENNGVVQATNRAAEASTGHIIVYLSDDFKCPKDWDILIARRIDRDQKQLLKVNDGYQPMENEVLTIPIMTRKLYDHLGYFFYPEYKSMWVDTDLAFTCKPYTILAPDLVFKHEHPVAGYGQYDETYNRSSANWNQGLEIYKRRSKEFGWSNAYNKMP